MSCFQLPFPHPFKDISYILTPPTDARRPIALLITLGQCLLRYKHPIRATFLLPSRTSSSSMLTDSFPCMILHRRNLACIGCGCPRASGANGSGTSTHQHQHQQHPSSNVATRAMPSPRFSSPSASVTYYSSAPPPSQSQTQQQQQQQPQAHQQPAQQHGQHLTVPSHIGFSQPQPPSSFGPTSSLPHVAAHPPKPSHPLLTPSGRAFAVGGKVQNISSDPLSPCIMYWPDNEPFPEQGQIRPNNLAGVAVSIVNIKFFSADVLFVC